MGAADKHRVHAGRGSQPGLDRAYLGWSVNLKVKLIVQDSFYVIYIVCKCVESSLRVTSEVCL